MATYDLGDLVRITATWQNNLSAAIDPSNVQLIIQNPNGTKSTFTYSSGAVIKDSTGVYHYDYIPSSSGTYTYRWEGTGAAIASGQSSFYVEDRLL